MKATTLSAIKLSCIAGLCLAFSGCAALGGKVKKAPCGPTAGMTDPCGNRTPVNKPEAFKDIETENFTLAEPV